MTNLSQAAADRLKGVKKLFASEKVPYLLAPLFSFIFLTFVFLISPGRNLVGLQPQFIPLEFAFSFSGGLGFF